MPLINCEVNLILTWSKDCVITNSTGERKFAITDTKLYVPVVTLSTQDNAELLQQLKSVFKRTINWNKYQSSIKKSDRNRYLNHLVDPSFQGLNRHFVLSFENEGDRTSHSTYFLPKVKLKDYNVVIDGKNFYSQPINIDLKTYKNIRRIATGQGDDYTTGCLLDYSYYFNKNYKIVGIDLSKQQVLDADPRPIQQINFTANLNRNGETTMLFIIEQEKETVLDFSQGTVKGFQAQFH